MMTVKIIPYIPGDGVGPEVTTAMRRILDAAVAKAVGAAAPWTQFAFIHLHICAFPILASTFIQLIFAGTLPAEEMVL